MKGQVQPLTAVLVTGLIVGAVATAFVWGTPLLEKRQAEQDFERNENNIRQVYDTALQVGTSGRGSSASVDVSLDSGDVRLDESRDFIEISFPATNPPYPAGTWTLVEGQRIGNLSFGSGAFADLSEDRRGVLAARPVSSAAETSIRYRIEFRNMLRRTPTGRRLELVDLRSASGQTTASNPEAIRFENVGVRTDSGSDAVQLADGPVERRRTVVEVSFE